MVRLILTLCVFFVWTTVPVQDIVVPPPAPAIETQSKDSGKDLTQLSAYEEFVRVSVPRIDVRRCGEALQRLFLLYGRSDNYFDQEARMAEADLLLEILKDATCVNRYFAVEQDEDGGGPVCPPVDQVAAPVTLQKIAPTVVLFQIQSFEWYDGECPDFAAANQHMSQAIRKRLAQLFPRDTVLDLRGNGGGYLDALAQLLSDTYSPSRGVTIAVLKDQNGTTEVVPTGRKGPFSCPTVALVDEDTASAAEMMSGALRGWCPSTLFVGKRTFGKGLAGRFEAEGTYHLNFTDAEYFVLSATGAMIAVNNVGIKPDVQVPDPFSGYENTATDKDIGYEDHPVFFRRDPVDPLIAVVRDTMIATQTIVDPMLRKSAMQASLLKTFGTVAKR